MRIALLAVCLISSLTSAQQPQPDPRFTPPPGPATKEETALVDKARAALERKAADVSAVLADSAYMPVHARTEFREVIKKHATAKPLTIVGPAEPGTKLTVNFRFLDSESKPVKGGLVYLYHTSAKGWYSDKAAHIQANSGDTKHARLFGYALTDDQGRVKLHTIRPAGYPNTNLPQHIHLHLTVEGKEVMVTELLFEDDPRLTREMREERERGGELAVKVKKLADGSEQCEATFTLRAN